MCVRVRACVREMPVCVCVSPRPLVSQSIFPTTTSQALAEVLMSIDRAIQKIHDESVLQGGMYTAEQKVALK